MSGTVESVTVDANEKTDVILAKQGDMPETFQPYPIDGDWNFTWNGNTVDFTGVFHFGDYQTITTAHGPGGVTRQIFYGLSHQVSGTATWNEDSRTLTYDMEPQEREDGKASTVTQSKPAECEKVSGAFTSEACKGFEESSLEFEGLKLHFTFNEDLSHFDGEADQIQYGGKGVTENEATTVVEMSGDLTAE